VPPRGFGGVLRPCRRWRRPPWRLPPRRVRPASGRTAARPPEAPRAVLRGRRSPPPRLLPTAGTSAVGSSARLRGMGARSGSSVGTSRLCVVGRSPASGRCWPGGSSRRCCCRAISAISSHNVRG
jgi:hypothetical protein